MRLPVYLSEEALQEEVVAYLFYEKEQQGLGERFLKEVEEALGKVSEHPTHYSFLDETKTLRDISLVRFPFVIIFEVKTDRIEVYHMNHTKKELR